MPQHREVEGDTGDVFRDPEYFIEALEDEPKTAFYSFAPQRLTASPSQRQFFRNFYPEARAEYRGYEGRAFREETMPGSFTDFLEDFPFLERYMSATQEQRGEARRRLAPSVRFAFG